MAQGANIMYGSQLKLWALFRELLKSPRRQGSGRFKAKICYKDGVPTSNTEADAPENVTVVGNALGTICIDTTNNHVYCCTAYTSASSFTWTQIA